MKRPVKFDEPPTDKKSGRRAYTQWIRPRMSGYLMACCDCGLVHQLQFKAFQVTKRLKNGAYRYVELPRTKYGVTFRLRRANGHATKLRRKEGKISPESARIIMETATTYAAALKRLARK